MIAGAVVFSMAACSGGTESESNGSDQTEENTDSQELAENADTVQEDNTEEEVEENTGEAEQCANRLFLLVRKHRSCSTGDPETDRCGSV